MLLIDMFLSNIKQERSAQDYALIFKHLQRCKRKRDNRKCSFVAFPFTRCRNEATRTPDPYVPNVVRYQLRYIPSLLMLQRYDKKIELKNF